MMLTMMGNKEDFVMESYVADEQVFISTREGEVNFSYWYESVEGFRRESPLRHPNPPKFFHHYIVRMGAKSRWVSLISLSRTYLFTAYSTSYKGFKGRFVKVQAVDGASFMVNCEPMPLYWQKL
ncbi:hypothetical protein CR513_34988, partial [Mucuna pruriens]